MALALLAGCGNTSTGGGANVGYYPDGGSSTGTVVISGAASGSFAVVSGAQYSNFFPAQETHNVVGFYVLPSPDSPLGDDTFGCVFALPGTELEAGTSTLADVTQLNCDLGASPGTSQIFWDIVNGFELTINAPGPETGDPISVWSYPTGSLKIKLGPDPLEAARADGGVVNVAITFAPPPPPG